MIHLALEEVFAELRARGAALYVDPSGRLRYVGLTAMTLDDPLRAAIAEHRQLLSELFTHAPGGRCAEPDCYRLRVEGAEHCPDHVANDREAAA